MSSARVKVLEGWSGVEIFSGDKISRKTRLSANDDENRHGSN